MREKTAMEKTNSAGGCQCGAVRYQTSGAPLALYACHCRHCQKQSSSAFGMSVWFKRADIKFTGDLKFYNTAGDSGREKTCAFCGKCGTRLYHDSGADFLSVKAGTLDDTSELKPTHHIWTKRAQPWLSPLFATSECYEGEPPEGM